MTPPHWMRRFRQSTFALVVLSTLVSHANQYTLADYYSLSREPALVQAVQLLDTHSEMLTGTPMATLMAHPSHIIFQDLQLFGARYATDDALTIVNNTTGEQVIYISHRHQAAPAAALAALISHEVMHHDRHNSLQEELQAWSQEARVWLSFKTLYPELEQVPIKACPLVDRLNAVAILLRSQQLETHLRQNQGYADLPETSPGFEKHAHEDLHFSFNDSGHHLD